MSVSGGVRGGVSGGGSEGWVRRVTCPLIKTQEFTNPATNNTDIIISPQKEGLVVIIRQRANGVKIIEEKIIKVRLAKSCELNVTNTNVSKYILYKL